MSKSDNGVRQQEMDRKGNAGARSPNVCIYDFSLGISKSAR